MSFSRVDLTAPPGRLGILVSDDIDTNNHVHTVVSKVNEDSPLAGRVFAGDQIIYMNHRDVHEMDAMGKVLVN